MRTINININEICTLLSRYNKIQLRETENNFEYTISSLEAFIEYIKEHYTPKSFNTVNIYFEIKSTKQFIINNYSDNVFDAIELFAQYENITFSDGINLILSNNNNSYKLAGDKIERTKTIITINEVIKEDGLKKLIEQAYSLFKSTKLTKIGDNFRIRNHEMDKIDIIDNNHYEYYFHRCYSLIDLVLKYLK